jgi:hypothetical protein
LLSSEGSSLAKKFRELERPRTQEPCAPLAPANRAFARSELQRGQQLLRARQLSRGSALTDGKIAT